MMGGFIWLESELGKGSSFYFVASFEKGDLSTFEPSPSQKSGVGEVFLNHSLISRPSSLTKPSDVKKKMVNTRKETEETCASDAEILNCDYKLIPYDRTREHATAKYLDETVSKASIISETLEKNSLKLELDNPCLFFKGMNVLLAEDNVVNQKVVCQQLKKFGTVVEVVSDGQQCLDALETSREKYDLILMDVQVKGNKQTNTLYSILLLYINRCFLLFSVCC